MYEALAWYPFPQQYQKISRTNTPKIRVGRKITAYILFSTIIAYKYQLRVLQPFFQPLCGNERNWIFRNLEFRGKILEFSEKSLSLEKKSLSLAEKFLSLGKSY